LRQM